MKKKIYYTIVTIFLLSITMSQCKCSKGKPKAPDVDISKVDLTFYRFDREFQQNDTFNTKAEMQALQKKYNSFYDVYIYKLMRFAEPNDSSDDIYTYINYFFMYRDMIQLYQMTQKAFPNTDANDEEIRRAFAYSKMYLPQLQLPKKVVYCISGLNAAAFTIDADYAGIGLDMYLNKDTLYNQIFPNYIAARLRKEMMCQNVMKAIYNYQYNDPYATSGALINNIIQVGKQQY